MDALQDSVFDWSLSVTNHELLQGRLIEGIEITSAGVGVNHLLGRAHRGWIVTYKNADADIWEENTSTFKQNVWTAYTATIGGSTTAPTPATTHLIYWFYRLNGDSLDIKFNYSHAASAGSAAGSGTYLFPIPTGLTIDTTKTQVNTSRYLATPLGNAYAADGSVECIGIVYAYDDSNLYINVHGSNSNPQVISAVASTFLPVNSAAIISYEFCANGIPVLDDYNTTTTESTDKTIALISSGNVTADIWVF